MSRYTHPLGMARLPFGCGSAHRMVRVGVAGGNGPLRWEAKNAEQSQSGRRPLPLKESLPSASRMMEVGRVRTVLGCRNPDRQESAAGRSEQLPRPFSVGEPVANVQAPKAKGHRSLSIGFRTPRPRVIGLFAGAYRRRFPSPAEE